MQNLPPPDKIGFMWQDRQTGELGSVIYDNQGRVENGVAWRVRVEVRVIDERPVQTTEGD